jgi:hypothetical protein
MATQHALTCPVCHASLLIEHSDSIGGSVMSNLILIDSSEETPKVKVAREAWEAAQVKYADAVKAGGVAQAALDAEAAQETPDPVKVKALEEEVAKTTEATAAALQESLDAEAAYKAARAAPLPPEVGFLSPDGKWSWGGTAWVAVEPVPPPLPAGFEAPEEAGEPVAVELTEEQKEAEAHAAAIRASNV